MEDCTINVGLALIMHIQDPECNVANKLVETNFTERERFGKVEAATALGHDRCNSWRAELG